MLWHCEPPFALTRTSAAEQLSTQIDFLAAIHVWQFQLWKFTHILRFS